MQGHFISRDQLFSGGEGKGWFRFGKDGIELLPLYCQSMYLKKIINFNENKDVNIEKTLRENEEKFREVANLLPQTVFELDIDGNLQKKTGLDCTLQKMLIFIEKVLV